MEIFAWCFQMTHLAMEAHSCLCGIVTQQNILILGFRKAMKWPNCHRYFMYHMWPNGEAKNTQNKFALWSLWFMTKRTKARVTTIVLSYLVQLLQDAKKAAYSRIRHLKWEQERDHSDATLLQDHTHTASVTEYCYHYSVFSVSIDC